LSASDGAVSSGDDAVLPLEVAHVLSLPVAVAGFEIDGATFLEADPAWIDGSAADRIVARADGVVLRGLDPGHGAAVPGVRFNLPLAEVRSRDREIDFDRGAEVFVVTRLLGRTDAQRTLARHDASSPTDGPTP
jgi:hypothetical protein